MRSSTSMFDGNLATMWLAMRLTSGANSATGRCLLMTPAALYMIHLTFCGSCTDKPVLDVLHQTLHETFQPPALTVFAQTEWQPVYRLSQATKCDCRNGSGVPFDHRTPQTDRLPQLVIRRYKSQEIERHRQITARHSCNIVINHLRFSLGGDLIDQDTELLPPLAAINVLDH